MQLITSLELRALDWSWNQMLRELNEWTFFLISRWMVTKTDKRDKMVWMKSKSRYTNSHSHARTSPLYNHFLCDGIFLKSFTTMRTTHTHINVGALEFWLCYHEYMLHEKWYQTILGSLINVTVFNVPPELEFMLIQMKWHVDPWI